MENGMDDKKSPGPEPAAPVGLGWIVFCVIVGLLAGAGINVALFFSNRPLFWWNDPRSVFLEAALVAAALGLIIALHRRRRKTEKTMGERRANRLLVISVALIVLCVAALPLFEFLFLVLALRRW